MPKGKPNVVLMVSDRQHWDSIHASGTAQVRTPHLDRLAGDGVLFRRAYTTSPICTPARMALLSGLYPHTHGMVANHQTRFGPHVMRYAADVTNLGQYLRPLGYACGYVGKWHLATGSRRPGFDDFVSRGRDYDVDSPADNEVLQLATRLGYRLGGKQGGDDLEPERSDFRLQVGPQLLPLAFHPSHYFMDRAIEWVRRMAHDPRPFLLVYSCRDPHPPFSAPEPFFGMYPPEETDIPATRHDPAGEWVRSNRKDIHLRRTLRGLTDEELQRVHAGFRSSVSYVDHLVGRLVATLVETEQFDNTVFIYTSDHGEMLGHHGLFGQFAVLYEDVLRIPLIVRPPGGLGRAQVCDRLVSHVDLAPTLVRWCGGTPPEGLHGADAGDLLRGGNGAIHEAVGGEYHSANWTDPPTPMRAWITERWKYVATQDGTDELYDLAADPRETRNLIDDVAAATARSEARRGFQAWLRATGDTWPAVRQPPFIQLEGVPVAGQRPA
ncbi:MAG: sulfatase-like hydrolase/transferase [Actinobacteria bacterium]|nr:sulfatase-like hydrolase/transferase [Actinomycetota bacterium]